MEPELAGWLVERLEVLRGLIPAVKPGGQAMDRRAGTQAPKGMGRLICQAVQTEVAAWDRFKNPRQAGSYAGLRSGVRVSDGSHPSLTIGLYLTQTAASGSLHPAGW